MEPKAKYKSDSNYELREHLFAINLQYKQNSLAPTCEINTDIFIFTLKIVHKMIWIAWQ